MKNKWKDNLGCGEEIVWDDMLLGEGQSCFCGDLFMDEIKLCSNCETLTELKGGKEQ